MDIYENSKLIDMKLIFGCILVLTVINSSVQIAGKYFEDISVDGRSTCYQLKSFADSINTLDKDAIPLLINDISRNDKVFIQFGKPTVSSFPPYFWKNNYRGIRSAYTIEWLLWTENPFQNHNKNKVVEESDVLLKIALNYYKYKFNLLIKNEDKQLTYEDMIVVQSIYKNWWEENKQLSINELRQKYENDSIWERTPYRWK